MGKIVNFYAEGEGFVVYLLLQGLVGDGLVDLCLRYKDKPVFPPDGTNVAVMPRVSAELAEIFRLLGPAVRVFAADCGGLENCTPLKGEFLTEALKEVLRAVVPSSERVGEIITFLENYRFDPSAVKAREEVLLEKLAFYAPLLVGKRQSVVFGWKYYLGLRGVPAVAFVFPRDRDALEAVLHNPAFSDKVFPLLLGRFPDEFLQRIKDAGFVPLRVEVESKNNLDSELKFLLYARRLAQRVKGAL
ncbi:MAG: hypothetical protein GXO08_01525 [Aquificae bacterium]|nr:hypothetical protein [Aquificota bacterium]